MSKLLVAACVVMMLAAAPSALGACMTPEQPASIDERLTSARFKDAAGRPESAYILQLSSPACLDGSDELDKVANARTIHVFSGNEGTRRRIGTLVGKTVRVRGTPFGAHTAHHHAPIVMDVSDIQAR